jgi:hypothetical protein
MPGTAGHFRLVGSFGGLVVVGSLWSARVLVGRLVARLVGLASPDFSRRFVE